MRKRVTRPMRRIVLAFVFLSALSYNLYAVLQKRKDAEKLRLRYKSPVLRDELTVVTAFFDIGSFQKGADPSQRQPTSYRQWMEAFARLNSPVVAYFDSNDTAQYFAELRYRHLPTKLTKIVKVDRDTLWSFRIKPEIARIFTKPGYPKHHPNTVVAEYSAAVQAKYEVLQMAIRDNPFKTRYFSWLDIGYFRDLTSAPGSIDGPLFSLCLPPGFRNDSVAYGQVYERNPILTAHQLIHRNADWLCGGYFVGQVDVLFNWTLEYQAAVRKALVEELMGADQQVIYMAFNTMKPSTKLQIYRGDGRYNTWFHLGFISRDACNQTAFPSPTQKTL